MTMEKKTRLDEVIEELRVRHGLSEEQLEDVRYEMAHYALIACVDSEIQKEAQGEFQKALRKRTDTFHAQYDSDHALCPKCGHDKCSSTYAGYILDTSDMKSYRDRNSTVCSSCGHICERHDRISFAQWDNKYSPA